MENMEKNNKLIAGFMKLGYRKNPYETEVECYIRNEKEYLLKELKYNTSWDWLMPVLEKITLAPYQECNERYVLLDKIRFEILHVNLPKAYIRMVEFIKWYNENKED